MEKELYIARDDYKLALSENEPHLLVNDLLDYYLWVTDGNDMVVINPNWFPEITKENSPKKVKLIIE